MEIVKIEAARRQGHGKGEARRLRSGDQIPAITYGKGEVTVPIAISPKDFIGVLKSEHGRNSVIELVVDGKDSMTVLIADYQYHPVSRSLLHADFRRIQLDEPVEVDIPLELIGKPQGVVLGGILRQVFRRLPIRCLPKDIPVKIVHDMTPVGLDESVSVSQLTLPEGVEVRLPAAQTVSAVVSEKRRGDAEEEKPAGGAPADAKAGEKPEAKA
ncbi:MAG: 50S ribosomal protein L25 [Polyangiaceae bacterium]|nr:50S ribosomal protein L25 [Polyangiaceae bacterium]